MIYSSWSAGVINLVEQRNHNRYVVKMYIKWDSGFWLLRKETAGNLYVKHVHERLNLFRDLVKFVERAHLEYKRMSLLEINSRIIIWKPFITTTKHYWFEFQKGLFFLGPPNRLLTTWNSFRRDQTFYGNVLMLDCKVISRETTTFKLQHFLIINRNINKVSRCEALDKSWF